MAVRPFARPTVAALLTVLLAAVLSACDGSRAADGTESSGSSGSTGSSPSSAPSASSPSPASAVPSPQAPRVSRYVAIGDSYTAAPGVPGVTSNDGCFRSSGNYPHLLAAALGVAELVDVSCSGADTQDVRGRQLDRLAPQLDAVTRRTDLVTIGLGGNDEDLFQRLLGGCERGQRSPREACFDEAGAAPILDRTEQRLVRVVRDVRAKAPSARVLLIGYPQVVGRTSCAAAPYVAGARFARETGHGLTQAVRRAAKASGATYVDVWSASAGHDLCSADPWVNGSSGPGAAPFHPFATEQAAVARLIEAALG